jgi:hypothetical protein
MDKEFSSRRKQAIADPVTQAALDDAIKAAKDLFGPVTKAVVARMNALLAGRLPSALSGAETATLMSLKARFNALAIEQRYFAEADLQRRLNPNENQTSFDELRSR